MPTEADLSLPPDWANGAVPLHVALADAIVDLVRTGELARGAPVPTERALAAQIAVSRATVAHAYQQLKTAGILDSRQGRGTWVAAGPNPERTAAERIAPLLADTSRSVDLALAVPGPPTDLRLAVQPAPSGSGYEPGGLPDLREAIAAMFTRQGCPTTPDEVMVTNGAHHAIALVMRHHLVAGDTVAVENSTYLGALDVARMIGARIASIESDRDGIDVDALEQLVERRRPALIYLNPTNQSPTGTTLSADRRRRVVRLAASSGIPVLDDATLADLTFAPGAPPPMLASIDRDAPVITVGSLSKVTWAGLRVGWIRATRALIEALVARRMVDDLAGSLPAQQAAITLVEDYERLARQRAALLAERHDHLVTLLAEHLPDWEVHPATGGTVLWPRLPHGANAATVATLAAALGVNVVPGSVVSPHGGAGDRLRLAHVLPPDELGIGVARLVDAWREYQELPQSRTPGGRALIV